MSRVLDSRIASGAVSKSYLDLPVYLLKEFAS